MGIKEEEAAEQLPNNKSELLERQEQLFKGLDQQYEMARISTHTQRGVGLGFSSHLPLQSSSFPR